MEIQTNKHLDEDEIQKTPLLNHFSKEDPSSTNEKPVIVKDIAATLSTEPSQKQESPSFVYLQSKQGLKNP